LIAVTGRNGERFAVDPTHIERVEAASDTVVHLVDGTKYVVTDSLADLLRLVRDDRAALTVSQRRLAGGTAQIADHASSVRNGTLRIERRRYDRSVPSDRSAADRRPVDGAPETDDT
jgi:flagellar protein FlbD